MELTPGKALRFTLCIVMLAGAVSCGRTGPRSGEWHFAVNGKPTSIVVVGQDADPVEKHAALELSRFLSAVTGADIETSTAPRAGKYPIKLGTHGINPSVGESGLLNKVENLSDQGFILHAGSEGMVITARTPLGVLFGVYAFLEEHIGMRWFFPGEEGEYRPYIPDLKIQAFSEVHNPAFETRMVRLHGTSHRAPIKETRDWIARNRMQVMYPVNPEHAEENLKRGNYPYGGGHILHRIVPDELFDEHPEYFGLYDGERRRQHGHRGQPCTTHPEVINLAVEYMLDWFERNPAGLFTLNNNDWPRFCECENCTALDPPEEAGRSGGMLSTRFFTFKNEVAVRVLDSYPDARIRTLAYQNFRLPPEGTVPDERLRVDLCDHGRCYRHSLDDPSCEANVFFRKMFDGWGEFDNQRGYYPYYNCMSGGIIATPMERIVASDLRYMHDLGHTHWTMITMPPDGDYGHIERAGSDPARQRKYWRGNAHMHYIQAKLAWDPEADPDKLLDEFNKKFYGPAADQMSRFREKLIFLWGNTPGHFMYGSPFVLTGRTMAEPDSLIGLKEILNEAEAAAAGHPEYAAKVAEDIKIFKASWVMAHEAYSARPVEDIQALRTDGPIVIDGYLDEGDWQKYEKVSGFIKRASGGEPAAAQTSVRLLYDEKYLYIGAEMEESEIEGIITGATERDSGRIWDDDTIEFFIDPDAEGLRYIHFAVNSAGVFRDSECRTGEPPAGDPTFESDAEIVSTVEDGRWRVEMRVSADSLGGVIRDDGTWRMDVGRVRRAGGAHEASTWMDGTFHQPENFRIVAFGGEN